MVVYVSLGSTCSVAAQIRNYDLCIGSLPFDWIRTPNFSEILNLFRTKFDGVLEFSKFNHLRDSDKFQVSGGCTSAIYYHRDVKLGFYHDFIAGKTLEEQWTEFRDRYQRRIDRLYSVLESASKIVFIRDELKANLLSLEAVDDFIEYVVTKYPSAMIKLVIIARDKKNRRVPVLNFVSDKVEIQIIRDTKPYSDWTRPNVPWESFLCAD